MRGTLENPPIILVQDRFKLGLSLTATAGVTLLFAIKLSTGTGRSVFFGLLPDTSVWRNFTLPDLCVVSPRVFDFGTRRSYLAHRYPHISIFLE